MKNELLKYHGQERGDSLTGADAQRFKTALVKSMTALKSKERAMEVLKNEYEENISMREYKIDLLETKVQFLEREVARSRDHATEERMTELEAENKNLLARLEISYKRMENFSLNTSNNEQALTKKAEREIEILKNNLAMAQSVIERFKHDKLGLEEKLIEEQELTRRAKEAHGPSSLLHRAGNAEKDEVITALTAEKKAFEEKYRAQTMELKKLEQKHKYATSQLETLSKKKGSAAKGNEAYIKQIDQMTAKSAEISADLGEKKKEIHKLKQENFVLSTRVTELEKKLNNIEKKAS
jgi:chromosome segregation ATPase